MRDSAANDINENPEEVPGRIAVSLDILSVLAKNLPSLSIGTIDKEFQIDGATNSNHKTASPESPPWFNEFARHEFTRAFQNKPVNIEYDVDGKSYRLHAFPITNGRSAVDKILYVTVDVTADKQRESDLKMALQREKELGELKSKFVSMASHEFKNPLTSILASAFLLSQLAPVNEDEESLLHINRIKRSVNKLTHILNEFHDLQKLDENAVQIAPTLVNIPQLIHEDLMSEMQPMQKAGQQINYEHYGNITATVDGQLLKSIAINLVSNALKFSDSDVKIKTNVSDGEVKLEVSDGGIGIPADQHVHVYDRYFKARNATQVSGKGLGLYIAKQHVMLLGGTISLESNLNTGTTITITIPTQLHQTNKNQ